MDTLIIAFDKSLRTLFVSAKSRRPHPDAHIIETALTNKDRHHAAGLMRVNHSGEVCAQALYQGQALAANPIIKKAMIQAAYEEEEHLAWTAKRIHELGARMSLFNPVWYLGALTIGIIAGKMEDKWNLGFLEEVEKQVGTHLQSHLDKLPEEDRKSRSIVEQMYIDETQHAQLAQQLGAAKLPWPIRKMMKASARIMTTLSYYL